MTKNNSTRSIILTGLFTALTIIGTMIKIPMPTGDFIHLGNSVVLLAVLLLGYKKGALAGGVGFAIFDLLNGFAAEAPYFIIETFIVGGAATLAFMAFNHHLDSVWKVTLVAISAGITKLLMTQVKNTLINLAAGADFQAAFIGAFAKIPATAINALGTIIIVSFAYFPLKKALDSTLSKQNTNNL